MKIQWEIDDDELDTLLCKTLKSLHESISDTYNYNILEGKNASLPLFSSNPVEEKRKLEEFIKAITMVHNYYCIYSERIGSEDFSDS